MSKRFGAVLATLVVTLFAGLAMADQPVNMAKVNAERPNVIQYTTQCQANLNQCKVECDKGDKWSCFGEATVITMDPLFPNYAKAISLFEKSCKQGVYSSCLALPQVIRQSKAH